MLKLIWPLAVLLAMGFGIARAQDSPDLEGTWTAKYKPGDGEVNIQLHINGDRSNVGIDLPLSAFQGLTREQVTQRTLRSSFRFDRDAGTVTFEGRWDDGRGTGAFAFVADRSFQAELRSRSFVTDEEDLLVLTVYDVDLAFADDLLSMDLGPLGTDDLIKAAIFDITPAFSRAIRDAGLRVASLEEYVQLRIFEITPTFIEEMKLLDVPGFAVEDLVSFRVHDVDPAFVRSIRDAGYDPTAEHLVQLRIFEVDGDFIAEMASVGYEGLSIDELVQLRVFDIDKRYVERLRDRGVHPADVAQLVETKIFDR